MGATGFAYDLARQFGLKLVEPRPALVPLTLSGEDALFRDLSGVAAEVEARCGGAAFREAALFTHRGLSGPAILQVSSYWRRGEPVGIDFLPDRDAGLAGRRQAQRSARRRLRALLARRAARSARRRRSPSGSRCRATCSMRSATAGLRDAGARLARLALPAQRHRRLRQGRGHRRRNQHRRTVVENDGKPNASQVCMRIGEAVDVTGWLGGYNFQWAWASGWAAGASRFRHLQPLLWRAAS